MISSGGELATFILPMTKQKAWIYIMRPKPWIQLHIMGMQWGYSIMGQCFLDSTAACKTPLLVDDDLGNDKEINRWSLPPWYSNGQKIAWLLPGYCIPKNHSHQSLSSIFYYSFRFPIKHDDFPQLLWYIQSVRQWAIINIVSFPSCKMMDLSIVM